MFRITPLFALDVKGFAALLLAFGVNQTVVDVLVTP